MQQPHTVVGRFAPSPSGRMHLGNVFAALIAWLSVRQQKGVMLLRMEDIDTQRCKPEYAQILRQDLAWLGLDFDMETQPQSQRGAVYQEYFDQLHAMQLLYPCYCTRSQLHSVNAPHSGENIVYSGTCLSLTPQQRAAMPRKPGWRVRVPERSFTVQDKLQGSYCEDLKTQCGDFIVRRADGAFVYQLAVTVDDGLSGVTEVVRGADLLSSTPRQMYLQELFGFPHPQYAHIPLLTAPDGRRLSKRDRDMDMGFLQARMTAPELLGKLSFAAGLTQTPSPISAQELIPEFTWEKLRRKQCKQTVILPPVQLSPAMSV